MQGFSENHNTLRVIHTGEEDAPGDSCVFGGSHPGGGRSLQSWQSVDGYIGYSVLPSSENMLCT